VKTTLVVALATAIALSVAGSASRASRTAPVTTETRWKLTFTRVAHRPSGL
jgi:hypothetical protein